MTEYAALEYFEIPGRGLVAVIHNPSRSINKGDHVVVDGKKFEVRGTETMRHLSARGILLREVTATTPGAQ